METNISAINIAKSFNDTIEMLDNLRLEDLKIQFENHEISKFNLEKQIKILVEKFGEESAFTTKIKNRLEFENKNLESLSLALEEEELQIKPLLKNTFRIHGRILENEKLLENVSLTFVDDNKLGIDELGEILTDVQGYFSVEFLLNTKNLEKFKDRSIFIVLNYKKKRILEHPILPIKNTSSFIEIDLKKNDHLKIMRSASSSKTTPRAKK